MKSKILSILFLMMVAVFFVGCSIGNLLVGSKWTDETVTYSFEKDGVLSVTASILSIDTTVQGTYTSEGNELTYSYSLAGISYTDTVIVETARTTMVWLNEDGQIVNTLRRLDD